MDGTGELSSPITRMLGSPPSVTNSSGVSAVGDTSRIGGIFRADPPGMRESALEKHAGGCAGAKLVASLALVASSSVLHREFDLDVVSGPDS